LAADIYLPPLSVTNGGIEWWWAIGWQSTIVIAVVAGGVYGRLIAIASRPMRRWLQLIPIALLSLLLLEGIDLMWQAARQRQVLAAIIKLGGELQSDIQGPHGNRVTIRRTEFTDAECGQLKDVLKEVPQLRDVWLMDTHVTEDGVKELQWAIPNCPIYVETKGKVTVSTP
jgi:hypothetical protein